MRRALAAGLAGMRANLVPGILLWMVGSALVLTYFLVPAAQPVYAAVEAQQNAWGVWFAAASSALCGALLPWCFLLALGRLRSGERARQLGFLLVFWIYRGVEVFFLYGFLGWLYGEARDPHTGAVDAGVVLKKMATDMLLYCALWSVPTTTLAYRWWEDCGGSWRRFRETFARDLFTVRMPALVLAAWMVWTPTVCLVYSLPSGLQVPIFNVVLCFWVLLVAVVAGQRPASEAG